MDLTTDPARAHAPDHRPSGPGPVDVTAYLARLGRTGPRTPDASTLRALHRAQLASVPYENLDIQLGRTEPLSSAGVLAKITAPGRGGYCYELNGAFALLLEALGFQVARVIAAVGRKDDPAPVWGNHLALLVRAGGTTWIADTGLGDGFTDPLPLRPGRHTQGPFTYEVERLADGEWWVGHHEWGAVPGYRMRTEPLPLSAFAPHHLRQSTSPESSFVQTLIVQRPLPDRTLTLRGTALTTDGPGGKHRLLLPDQAAFETALSTRFGIPTASLDTARLYTRARTQTEAWLARRAPASSG
ncbi:arylamine N-acetyltransferase [Nocardiopsis sp. CNT-189]|uniref:arylamine N-acetyltransferase family protein n=1 Tax=Nocardiopsis oceanisediminis TaxID=2816862 RepID=UPI003B3217DB